MWVRQYSDFHGQWSVNLSESFNPNITVLEYYIFENVNLRKAKDFEVFRNVDNT